MADDEPYVRRSVKDIAAGLKGGEVGRVPVTSKTAKPVVKPKIDRSISASVPPASTSIGKTPNLPAGGPQGDQALPTLPRRPAERPAPPGVPPRRENGTGRPKPPVPGIPPRRPTDGPSLPPRKPSDSSVITNGSTSEGPVPSVPPRNTIDRPTLPTRRTSQASVASTASAVSSISRVSTASARTNGTSRTTSSDQSRVRAPAYDPSTLPPLPPKREKTVEQHESPPSLPSRGTPSLLSRGKSIPLVNRFVKDDPPAPSLPTRPGSAAPDQPARRLPPTAVPPVAPRPQRANGHVNGANGVNGTNGHVGVPQASGVIILNAQSFDDVVLNSGKPALIDFSANFCKYCKELDPIYDEIGNDFSHVGDRLVIGKVDCAVQKGLGSRFDIQGWPTIKWFDGRGSPPEIYPYARDYQSLADYIEEKTGFKPQKGSVGAPPIPLGTRPDLSALMSTKPRADTAATSASTEGCLQCRDFSGPDNHAAKFPRQNVRSLDTLAHELTAPFQSLADKARAIFTWMHHNIAYDCDSFFGNCVRGVTPLETLQSGLAVCAGYAGLYADLALKAGLECVVVGGHGKGYGHSELKPGEPCPPESQGHAWNAVKIDSGHPSGNGSWYWKVIDPCWGAGHISDKQYHKAFNSHQFTDSNIDFGRKHFPEDRKYQYREDGRTLTWQEYFIGDTGGEGPSVFSNVPGQNGIDEARFKPERKHIPSDRNAHSETGGIVRFQFQRVCDHWRPEVNGSGPDLLYTIPVYENGQKRQVPFETNGTYWWCDVDVSKLGKKGDTVSIWTADTIGGKSSRGMSKDEYLRLQRSGKGWGGSGLAAWTLV